MRRMDKGDVPQILRDNHDTWLADFLADPQNATKRYRYRHSDIKQALVDETNAKCVYCESKIGHNTPGDVEHKVPTAVDRERHFEWANLTIACNECNRRKNDYFDAVKPFLDPYNDDVEDRLLHRGPVVYWRPADSEAELSVRILELNATTRLQLILRKVEKLEELAVLRDRIAKEGDPGLRELLLQRLESLKHTSSEYSAMICAACQPAAAA